jgi:caffeoyl-CoA O-methyltransferase
MGGSIVADEIARYVGPGFIDESPALRALREETARMPNAIMQLGVDPAALLAWLVRLTGARRTLEVGTFTGYSALAVAQALPPDGRIVACDVSEEWTAVARAHWARAGVADKIDLRNAPAVQTLDARLAPGEAGRFDLAFVDADKASYDAYYERGLQLVRPGGLLVFDNMLWSGRVAAAAAGEADPTTVALDALNQKARRDPRVDACLLTVGDGLLLARRR